MSSAEEHIQQPVFLNERHKLRVNILITSGWLKNEIKYFLDDFGITQQQFNILRILRGARGEPMSTNEISDRMIDKKSDASRIVDRLITKKLVWKQPCPHDARRIQVFIAEEGLKLLEDIDQKLTKLDAIFKNITQEEAITLNSLLEKIRRT